MKPAAFLSLTLFALAVATLTAQQKGKGKPAPKLTFEIKQLHKDNSEGIAVGDIDGEGITEPAALLPKMTEGEQVVEDYVAMHMTLRRHPVALIRHKLTPGLNLPPPAI